jgi:hypothetical protein
MKGKLNTPDCFNTATKHRLSYLNHGLSRGILLRKEKEYHFTGLGSHRVKYYSMVGDVVYHKNIQELMKELQLEHASGHLTFVADPSKVSLKAVSLHSASKCLPPHWLLRFT